jgi:hypothetical protein
MMKNDKFLIAIIGGIILLVVVALVLVLARAQNQEYVADDSPAGVVQNYFVAIQRKDYERAYSYLSDELRTKPNLDRFIRDMSNIRDESSLKLGETRLGDVTTQVDVALSTYSGGGIFDSGTYTNQGTVTLRATADGQWKLTSFPYPYWGYDWDQPKSN